MSEKELGSVPFLIVLKMTYTQQRAIISSVFVSFIMFLKMISTQQYALISISMIAFGVFCFLMYCLNLLLQISQSDLFHMKKQNK